MYHLEIICWCFFGVFLSNPRNDVASAADTSSNWNGKWFPNPPNTVDDSNPTVEYSASNSDRHMMGIKSSNCDNAQTNLTIDWDNSPLDYTCFENKYLYYPQLVPPIEISYNIPKEYEAPHKCMNEPIHYNERISTFGTHRPLWAKFGEYLYLPVQRWLHNLEHGSIVLLYHPCANPQQLNLLKKLVKRCLYRHIITPYRLLTTEYPFALVSWGYSLEMSVVEPNVVISFIKEHALRGPEKKFTDGQFDYKLIDHADIVSDEEDSKLCPNL